MSKAFDAQIDALYAVPLSQFVAARSALAKTTSGDDAKRIKTLAKPTTLPWVVNQLRWHERTLYERVMKAGAALRAAQVAALEGRSAKVAEATATHRDALGQAVSAAMRLAREGGVRVDSDALLRMLETVSLADSLKEPHGRFTDVVEPAGFEALLGVAVKATDAFGKAPGHAKPDTTRARSRAPHESMAEAARKEAAQKERADAEAVAAYAAALKKAERAVEEARAKEGEARDAWREARDRADAADRALAELKESRR